MHKYFITLTDCRRLAEARRAKGLTQSFVAQQVGCKQSALSMLESGRTDKVAEETIEKIAALLDVTLSPAPETGAPFALSPSIPSGLGFCPDAGCPGNVPFDVSGRVLFWPALQTGVRCRYCGEMLETACPACGAPLREGACCSACGEPFVAPAIPPGVEPAVWAESRRRVLAELRALGVPAAADHPSERVQR
ncbi:MAG: helix-turn-helix domain-containing protein [Kiritimatiellae bacterium]|nr:helix-turn-helix domain-containing protein [Kiritimatiellia bacterium]